MRKFVVDVDADDEIYSFREATSKMATNEEARLVRVRNEVRSAASHPGDFTWNG